MELHSLNSPEHSLDELVEFVDRVLKVGDEAKIKSLILGHLQYGTLELIYDGDTIVAACRYNIKGTIADILDLIIDENYSGIPVMKSLILNGWKKWPGVRYLRFWRMGKYPLRKPRIYPISRFFHL